MKSAEIRLGYFKQGDDLTYFMEQSEGNAVGAFKKFSENMDIVSQHLFAIGAVIEESGAKTEDVTIDADTHFIMIHGPDELIDKLLGLELVEKCEDIDEECEDEDCVCEHDHECGDMSCGDCEHYKAEQDAKESEKPKNE